MNTLERKTQAFAAFEHMGWEDADVCQSYDENFGLVTIQSMSALLQAANVRTNAHILDVCTGVGYGAGLAAQQGAIATGLDVSLQQVKLAQSRYPKARFIQGDGCALPFSDGRFDAVINSIGIPHLADPDQALREAFRVLKPGGRLAFTVYDRPENAVGFGVVYQAVAAHGSLDVGLPQGPNFFLFSDPNEAKQRLEAAGFTAVSVEIVPQTWTFSTPDVAIAAILKGTVRAAATLKGQPEQAWPSIRAAIWELFSPFKHDDHYTVPMPVVLASALKS
ncbi:MAG: methyltransferase domain-containing protein [Elainellaceae cyanobacterium]